MCVGFLEAQFTCCDRDPGGARLWVTVFKCQFHLKCDIHCSPQGTHTQELSSLLSSVHGLTEARHFTWEEPSLTEPSALGMVLPSSAAASARCLVQVKGHLMVAQTVPMFYSTIYGHPSGSHGGNCELGCCLHLIKAAVWPFLLCVFLTLMRTLDLTSQGIPKLCSMVADHLPLLSSEQGLQPPMSLLILCDIRQRW